MQSDPTHNNVPKSHDLEWPASVHKKPLETLQDYSLFNRHLTRPDICLIPEGSWPVGFHFDQRDWAGKTQ
jgi:hypothetical protein